METGKILKNEYDVLFENRNLFVVSDAISGKLFDKSIKVAVFIHVYYKEVLEKYKDYIFNRTITTSKKCDELIEIYNKWANENYSSKINHRA